MWHMPHLLAEQIVAVVVLGCGTKVDAMWHVPHRKLLKKISLKDRNYARGMHFYVKVMG